MSGWVVPAYQQPGVQLPPGVAVAGMGRRVAAWLLDGLLVGFLAFIPVVMAFATGAITFNQQAIDQIDWQAYRPFANVTAPLFQVNTGLLIVAAAVFIALNAAYYAGSWVGFGGTPCQRGLKLRVADVASGNNLSVVRAFLRWAVLQGLSIVISAAFVVVFLGKLATIPANEWMGGGYYLGSTSADLYGGLSIWSTLLSGLSGLWIIILIVSAGTNPARRGLHDRLSGSIVVGPSQAVPNWPGYPYPQTPGYPPQTPGYPYPQTPGYPPQTPGYPPQQPGYPPQQPGYPPQQPGYPPQQPGYPPQTPGYPPQAWPGYPPQTPGYPPHGTAYPPQGQMYPQQAWPGSQPQATPPTPPVSPAPVDQPGEDPENGAPCQ